MKMSSVIWRPLGLFSMPLEEPFQTLCTPIQQIRQIIAEIKPPCSGAFLTVRIYFYDFQFTSPSDLKRKNSSCQFRKILLPLHWSPIKKGDKIKMTKLHHHVSIRIKTNCFSPEKILYGFTLSKACTIHTCSKTGYLMINLLYQ